MSFAPSAQFSPTARGRACATLFQKASLVCPLRVRPDMSTIVPLRKTGMRTPVSSNRRSAAWMAALAFRVSNIVSMSSRCTPASTRAAICM